MYLISVYFDESTEKRIRTFIHDVANVCGNSFMVDNSVPPHMTISSFETLHEKEVREILNGVLLKIKRNKIEWVTVGTFPTVIFIQPVLSEYLHNISSAIIELAKKSPYRVIASWELK